MTQVTAAVAEKISAELRDAARAIAKKHGLEVRYKGGSYNPSEFRPKIEFFTVGNDTGEGAPQSTIMLAMARNANLDASKTFTCAGDVFRLVDFNSRARKTPWIGERIKDGKRFRFHDSQFRHQIENPIRRAA